ncbi:MAG: Asp-tRNA(Asn)/Glu-tRNA(Gln) amidotransferase subunit GatC [Candidatus Calescibacterium sp.]|nr:Asp-tRNA(Asn)/Glu-tRNA(Gln) amidotransferase subunit GatC [Candidatus Calescibacterium sp.]MCX7734032.1 Asp-tRNA(Asn)/Glu-tRNA(Gln) amidotransferase subunit GatC [bacterium]MDW8086368.1 Asp-tRNA(Asn)/Glu-tRNA(Gln) amidotransferase subunit GatC [Candidatus Calescibacterium sp.]
MEFEEILELCALDIPLDKKEDFKRQVEKIIQFYNTLSELDLGDIKPTTWRFESKQEFRDDIPERFEDADMIVKGFPREVQGFCFIPQVLEYRKK